MTIPYVTNISIATTDGYRKRVTLSDGGYTNYARLLLAIKIGRPLTSKEVAHHINGDPTDDRFENLEVLESQAVHARLHIHVVNDKRWPLTNGCRRCGCPLDERTVACLTCSSRHNQRARKNGRKPFLVRTHCAKCGIPTDEYRKGCDTCRVRKAGRIKRGVLI